MSAIPALTRIDAAASQLAPLAPQLARAMRHDAVDLAELLDAARSRVDIQTDTHRVDLAIHDRLAAAVEALSPAANADTLSPSISVVLRDGSLLAAPPANFDAASSLPVKILADGTRIAATDPRTDHAAVLWPDGTMVHPISLRTPKGKPFANWDDADQACRALRVLGFNDWRLALLPEWERYVIDRTRYAPALDTNLYPDIQTSDWHWTATELANGQKDVAGRSVSAWYVGASGGYVYDGHRHDGGFALAVRRVGQ